MNFRLKSRTYSIITGGQALDTLANIIGPKGRLLGITIANTGTAAVDTAIFKLFYFMGIDIPIAVGKINAVGTLEWWAGIDGRHKEALVDLVAAPANDVVKGFWPLAMNPQWMDDTHNSVPMTLKLEVTLAGTLSVATIWYTDDTPSASGESC